MKKTPFHFNLQRLSFILLFLAVLTMYAAGDEGVHIDISPNPVGRGDRFGITILADIEDSEMIDINQPDLADGIVLLRGPYIRPVWVETADQGQQRKTEISYLYRCDETGRFEVGSYRIITPRRIFSTDPQLLEVGYYQNRELIIPLEIEWDIQPDIAYVGQNVICILNALEQPDIRLFEESLVESPAEGFFQPAEGVGEIRGYSRGGVELYEIPVGSYIFTPSAVGTSILPRAQVRWENGLAGSRAREIEVRPLPETAKQSGAVGSFRLDAKVDVQDLEVGQNAAVTVRITGTGNLNYLQLPEIIAPSFSLLEKDEESQYTATMQGYRGWRQYTYTLVAESAGPGRILVKGLSAFDPATERVYFSPGDSFPVNISPQLGGPEEELEGSGFPFSPVSYTELSRVSMSLRFSSRIEYLWLLPGPLVFLFFFFSRKRKALLSVMLFVFLSFSPAELATGEIAESLKAAEKAYREGQFLSAESLYDEILALEPDIVDLYYNSALCAYQQGKIGQAVLKIRSALVMKPMDTVYRRFLDYLNSEYGVVTQIDLPFLFHPDFFLLFLTISINMAGFIGVLYLFKRKNSYFIAAMLMFTISIVSGIGMTYAIFSSKGETAVVMMQDSGLYEVKKIPKKNSETDFVLQPGETVKINGGTEDFFFITTSLGQKGWIPLAKVRKVPGIFELSGLAE